MRGIVDKIARPSQLRADLPQPIGIGGILAADHQNRVHQLGKVMHRLLAVLSCVADIPDIRPHDLRKPRFSAAMMLRVSSTESVVCVI